MVLSKWWRQIASHSHETYFKQTSEKNRSYNKNITLKKCSPGPRNWHPLVRTAAQRFADICWGYCCSDNNSVTILSPSERTMHALLDRPSSSRSWQCIRLISFLWIGRLRTHLLFDLSDITLQARGLCELFDSSSEESVEKLS